MLASNNTYATPATADTLFTDGSQHIAHRRTRPGAAFAAQSRKGVRDALVLVKPIDVFARFDGEIGGKWDTFQEAGNGSTRISVVVKSTEVEYAVDNIMDLQRPERYPEYLVVEPIVDDLTAGQDYCVFIVGAPGHGKTHALLSGSDGDTGLAYTMARSLLMQKREQKTQAYLAENRHIAGMSFSMFELNADGSVLDLVDPTNHEAMVDPALPEDARELRILHLSSKELKTQATAVEDLFDASQRRGAASKDAADAATTDLNPSVVVKFTITFEAERGALVDDNPLTTSLYLIDVHAGERDKFRKVCDALADGDLSTTAFSTPVMRLVLPKILDYGVEKHVAVVACMRAVPQEKLQTLATLKAVRSAYELRLEDTRRLADQLLTPTSLSSDAFSLDDLDDFSLERGVMQSQDNRIKRVEQKLEQKDKQIQKLTSMLETKEKVLVETRFQRVRAEETEQDAMNAANLLRARAESLKKLQEDALTLSRENDRLRRELVDANTRRAESVTDVRSRIDAANDSKYRVLEELDALKKQLTALAANARETPHPMLVAELCDMLDVQQAKQKRPSKCSRTSTSSPFDRLYPFPSKIPAEPHFRLNGGSSSRTVSPNIFPPRNTRPIRGGFAPPVPSGGGRGATMSPNGPPRQFSRSRSPQGRSTFKGSYLRQTRSASTEANRMPVY